MTVRFVHTADWQLGMTRQFLTEEAQARFSQARIDAIRTIARVVREEDAAFVVVAGDVFETNQVQPRTVRRAVEALSEVPVPVFLLPGNHDPLNAGSVFRSPTFERHRPENVVVLNDATPRVPVPGVEVIGAPWTSKRALRDLVESVTAELDSVPGMTRILVAHGAVRDAMTGENPAAIDVGKAEAAIAAGRISYLALGDRHSTTSVGTTGRIYYSGSPEPTAYDETDAGNVLVVEITDARVCVVRPRPVGTWRFVQEAFELDNHTGVEPLAKWLDSQAAKDRCVIRIPVLGTISLSVDAQLQDLLDRHSDLFGALELVDTPDVLVVRPDDDDFADLELTGFAADAVQELRAEAADGPQAASARDALALLVRLKRGAGTRS